MEPRGSQIVCVIPAYRASATIVDVVRSALKYADAVVVVDDCCPEQTHAVARKAFENTASVYIIARKSNGGVGAATKDGIGFAIEHDADIIVKLDADGQMDASFIRNIRTIFAESASLVCLKGNRFFDAGVLGKMPRVRLFGNAALSLMSKFASGYWNLTDPTNGYVAFNARLLRLLPWERFADSYFFELSVLAELGLRRLPIAELEMPTIYTIAPSSLSITRVLWEFPPRLIRLCVRRILVQYFVFDLNFGSLCAAFGALLMAFGIVFGIYEWVMGFVTGEPRAPGIVMLAALPFLLGFQLLLTAVLYDVQLSSKTDHHYLTATDMSNSAFARSRATDSTRAT